MSSKLTVCMRFSEQLKKKRKKKLLGEGVRKGGLTQQGSREKNSEGLDTLGLASVAKLFGLLANHHAVCNWSPVVASICCSVPAELVYPRKPDYHTETGQHEITY